MRTFVIAVLLIVLSSCTYLMAQQIKYPASKMVDQKDNYHGTEISDPYRWLEDGDSEETKNWVKSQNEVTDNYLAKIPFRDQIKNRLTDLWNYEKFSAPNKVGEYYFFFRNDGLQEQSILYYQKGLNGAPEVFLDPNTLSTDGSVSISSLAYSNDNKYMSYGISRGGSDWNEFFVMDIASKKLLPDHLKWVKFSGMAWYKDGFYYSRYDEPKGENKLKAVNEFHKIYYHKIGDDQSKDVLVYEAKDFPKRYFSAQVTDDEKFLFIYASEGAGDDNALYYKDLSKSDAIKPLFDAFEDSYSVIDALEGKFLIQTNKKAPFSKVVLVDPANPNEANWETIIPEQNFTIRSVSLISNKLFVSYLKDVASHVYVYNLKGSKIAEVKLPEVGTVSGFGGKNTDTEIFYSFTSFTYPSTIFRYDVKNNTSEVFKRPAVKFNVDEFESKQVFYTSKDGTKIPMFIVHKKGLKLDGTNPTMLYAYGGFNISLTPGFRLSILPLLENGGIFAMANLRGGSEYGDAWHEAGMLDKKQNVFDDFIAAAEYLIKEKYTSPEKLAINGGSNGGLLVGAVMLQRPELFKVAIPEVGVLDMLRYHKFTIGWGWIPEYGSADNPEQFPFLVKYSPLHNIKSGVNYPATLITTADHDDRVFPAHSFKFGAALQNTYKGTEPMLLRIETNVGHGAGTSTSKSIELAADKLAFMLYNMGYKNVK